MIDQEIVIVCAVVFAMLIATRESNVPVLSDAVPAMNSPASRNVPLVSAAVKNPVIDATFDTLFALAVTLRYVSV